MESSTKRKTLAQPRCLSELLPSLGGIFPEDVQQTFTDRKQPRPPRVQTLTADKVMKPMTYHEMRANLLVLRPQSPKISQPSASSRKEWVSSVKVDYKTVSHTANGQLKNNPVRKVLNFQQPKPKPLNSRVPENTVDTPKFPRPDFRPKKSVYTQARINNNVRISGVFQIPETPMETKPSTIKRNVTVNHYQPKFNKRMTIANKETNFHQPKPVKRMTIANKENNPLPLQPHRNNGYQHYQPKLKTPILPTPVNKKKPRKVDIDTPDNSSWKSNDASFLEKEQEIQKQIQAVKPEQSNVATLTKEPIISTPSSTPFKEYRTVQEYFNQSSEAENSVMYNDNTIMCFDKASECKENREESVIVSLCDLFNKATVKTDKAEADLEALLEMKSQSESNIKMIETGIRILSNIKQSQIDSLKRVNKLIEEHKHGKTESDDVKDKTLVGESNLPDILVISPKDPSPIVSRPCSVIKSNRAVKLSPTYKIPRKNSLCLRKSLVYKSMPNMSTLTPVKDMDGTALNVYMKMKEQMNFLSTPTVNRAGVVPDTPMVTSHNLQKQLDKLYNGS